MPVQWPHKRSHFFLQKSRKETEIIFPFFFLILNQYSVRRSEFNNTITMSAVTLA